MSIGTNKQINRFDSIDPKEKEIGKMILLAELSQSKEQTSLDLSRQTHFVDSDTLRLVSEFHKLENLELRNCKEIKIKDLASLSSLPLKYLGLEGCSGINPEIQKKFYGQEVGKLLSSLQNLVMADEVQPHVSNEITIEKIVPAQAFPSTIVSNDSIIAEKPNTKLSSVEATQIKAQQPSKSL